MKRLILVCSLILVGMVFPANAMTNKDLQKAISDWEKVFSQAWNKYHSGSSRTISWKDDLNRDNQKETIVVKFNYGGTDVMTCSFKIYHPRYGLLLQKDIPIIGGRGLYFVDLDPDSRGKEIIIWYWFGANPPTYSVSLYAWPAQDCLIEEYSDSIMTESPINPIEVCQKFIADYKKSKARQAEFNKLRSDTLEEAMEKYDGLNDKFRGIKRTSYPGPFRLRFRNKKTIGNWATITTYVVDKNGNQEGESFSYLFKKDSKGWWVVLACDEKAITSAEVKKLGLTSKIVKELDWWEHPG